MTEDEIARLFRATLLRPLAEFGRSTIASDSSEGKRSNWSYVPLTFDGLEDSCRIARERLQENPLFISELEHRGIERMLLYKTLLLTGLRCNELRSITLSRVDVKSERPNIELLAKDEKNREGPTIPLSREFAQELGQWIENHSKGNRNGVLRITNTDKTPLFRVPEGMFKFSIGILRWQESQKKTIEEGRWTSMPCG